MPDAPPLTPGLYLVATPIGNLRDITLRALDTLRTVDLIAAEDTRMTGKLLHLLGLPKKQLTIYNDHATDAQRDALLNAIREGKSVALVSDAGTPLISDPGYRLVRACREAGLPVTSLPGANAPLTALQLSGLPSDRFTFIGFLPPKSAARRTVLAEWKDIPSTLILFETGPRLPASLADMADILGDRQACVTRELTKLHEEARTATLTELATYYSEAPKGEIVVVIGPAAVAAMSYDDLAKQLKTALETMSMRDAVDAITIASGAPRKKLYELALQFKA